LDGRPAGPDPARRRGRPPRGDLVLAGVVQLRRGPDRRPGPPGGPLRAGLRPEGPVRAGQRPRRGERGGAGPPRGLGGRRRRGPGRGPKGPGAEPGNRHGRPQRRGLRTVLRGLVTTGAATPDGLSRLAATWYSGTSFTVDVNLAAGRRHGLELYLLDWD